MEIKDQFDVCIVGGGIAGNYLAYLLSRTDLQVVIIEEHEEVGRPFQCAGIVSMKLAKLIDLPSEIILNRVSTASLEFPSNKSVDLAGNERPFVIDRVELDKLYYKKAKSSENIHFLLGEKFKSFKTLNRKNPPFIRINTSKRTLQTTLLIGCDGPLSQVAKQLGIINNIIYATQIRTKANFDTNKAYMYFNERWNSLFGWIVPEGTDVFRIGIGSSDKLRESFEIFLNKIGIHFEDRIDQQGGIIPLGPMNKLAHDHILLLGDSASMVKATTGGGIIMILIASKFAANCIINCFRTKDFSKTFIKKHYETPCSAHIGNQLKLHYVIRYLLQNFTNNNLEALYNLLEINEIKNIISFYGDMDFPLRVALKLLSNWRFIKFLVKFALKNPRVMIKSIYYLLN